jgi:hypothetical protein
MKFKEWFSSSGRKPAPEKISLTPEEEAVLERVAQKVVEWKMAVPAILFLESVKPLNYIGAQGMIFFEPLVQGIFSIKDYDTLRSALEQRESIESLLQKIEALDAVAFRREKLYRKKVREERKKWKWYQRYLGIRQPKITIDPAELEAADRKSKSPDSQDQTGNNS